MLAARCDPNPDLSGAGPLDHAAVVVVFVYVRV